jgi:hypothetical protein
VKPGSLARTKRRERPIRRRPAAWRISPGTRHAAGDPPSARHAGAAGGLEQDHGGAEGGLDLREAVQRRRTLPPADRADLLAKSRKRTRDVAQRDGGEAAARHLAPPHHLQRAVEGCGRLVTVGDVERDAIPKHAAIGQAVRVATIRCGSACFSTWRCRSPT